MNFTDKIFGSGSKWSGRLTQIEAGMLSMQSEVRRLVDSIDKIADMTGDIRVIDSRILSMEQDIRELRHGEGFVRNKTQGQPGINREYP